MPPGGWGIPEPYGSVLPDSFEVLGIDQQDFSQMFSLMDIDGSGDLAYDEFIQAFIKARRRSRDACFVQHLRHGMAL